MSRRQVLMCCGAAAAGPVHQPCLRGAIGLRNPCLGALPQELASTTWSTRPWKAWIRTSSGMRTCHLLGTGDRGSGCSIHPDMHRWWHPVECSPPACHVNAACVADDAASVDRAYVQSSSRCAPTSRLARAGRCSPSTMRSTTPGEPRAEWTTFHVPNAYAAPRGRAVRGRFEWVASVHPYREDALERLQARIARAGGGREVAAQRNEHRPARSALPALLRPRWPQAACR